MLLKEVGLQVRMGPEKLHWIACAPAVGEDLHVCGSRDTAEEAREVVKDLRGTWSKHGEDVEVFTCESGAVYAFCVTDRPNVIPVGD